MPNCYSFEHETVICEKQCGKTLSCGHKCEAACADDCICIPCAKAKERQVDDTLPIKEISRTKPKPRIGSNEDKDSDPDIDPDTLLKEASAKGNNRLLQLFTDARPAAMSQSAAVSGGQSPTISRDISKSAREKVPRRHPSVRRTQKKGKAQPLSSSSSATSSSVAEDDGQRSAKSKERIMLSTAPAVAGGILKEPAEATKVPKSAVQKPQPQPVLGDLIDLSDMDPPTTQQQLPSRNVTTDGESNSTIPDLL